jgi:transcription elongation factor Elf1
MNNCSICGEEEYSITANGDIHKHETENIFMCSVCTQKYIKLPSKKQAAFKLPMELLCRKKGVKNGKRD